MITDAQTRFSSGQALTTGTVVSTNSYDTGSARDVGRGKELRIIVTTDTAFIGGTSVQANIVESAASDLTGATVVASGPVVAEAALTAGALLLDIALPRTSKRYLGIQYNNAGTHTTGSVSAHIVFDTDSRTYFASNTGY